MRPLFPYYGSKWRDARRYPASHNGTVIEPFAGSAGYSTWYAPSRVLLYDIDPIVYGVWSFLLGSSEINILSLPDLDEGMSVDDLNVCPEAKWFIGFWLNRGSSQPKKTKTAFSSRTERGQLVWSERARERVASDLKYLRGWSVYNHAYDAAPVYDATYFVDPPYADKGKYYRYNVVDYTALAKWCRSAPVPMIVCEQEGADWLPFTPLASIKSTKGVSHEVVWTK